MRTVVALLSLVSFASAEWTPGRACYGAGGGHGSWTCGNSEAGCTAVGGVASYKDGYVSARMGCCMCEAGCDHSKETNAKSVCSKVYGKQNGQPIGENPGAIAGIAAGAFVLLCLVGYGFYAKKKGKFPFKPKGAAPPPKGGGPPTEMELETA